MKCFSSVRLTKCVRVRLSCSQLKSLRANYQGPNTVSGLFHISADSKTADTKTKCCSTH